MVELTDGAERLGDHANELPTTLRALILRRLGRQAEGVLLMETSLTRWLACGRKDLAIEAFVLLAVLEWDMDRRSQAVEHFDSALAMGAPEGYRTVFMNYQPVAGELLRACLDQGLHSAYCRSLLRDDSKVSVDVPSAKDLPGVRGREQLNPREIEILQLMAQGLSNKEIAGKLFLTVSTVKWHSSNIYSKLDVNNRTTAVAVARSHGVIAEP